MAKRHSYKEVDVSEVTGNCVLHITITGKKLFKVKLKLAKVLFKVGAWLIGSDYKIEHKVE